MYSTATKTTLVILVLLLGFVIFQQFRINNMDAAYQKANDQKFSYLDHQLEKYENYEQANVNDNTNNTKFTQVNNANKTLTYRVTDLQSQTKSLKEQIQALKSENETLIKENKEKEVAMRRLEESNIALKAELNTLQKTIANPKVKPTNANPSQMEETLIGMVFGDLSTETFQLEGIKTGL
jgi:seryl-tRNA synthetase